MPATTPVNPANAPAGHPSGIAPDRAWAGCSCVVCGQASSQPVLSIPHPDAPDGISTIVQCAGCGLRRLDPRPGPVALSRYYREATSYNAFEGRRRSPRSQAVWDYLRDCFSSPRRLSGLQRLFAPLGREAAQHQFDINVPIDGRAGLRVLEVGSGFGDLLLYLQSRGCSVTGTDLSTAAAEKARSLGIEVRVGNLVDLHFPTAAFDVAVLSHSLEHLPDPRRELAELHRILATGGELHIAVPNGAAAALAAYGADWHQVSHPFHFWYFDPDNLVRLVREHGFEPVTSPVTTSRHHILGTFITELRSGVFAGSIRRFTRYLAGTAFNPKAGDVVRLVCRRTQ